MLTVFIATHVFRLLPDARSALFQLPALLVRLDTSHQTAIPAMSGTIHLWPVRLPALYVLVSISIA